MSDVESIVNFDKWSATTFSVPFSSSILSCLKVSKISKSWFDFPLFGHSMRKWKYWWGICIFIAMFRFNPFLTLRDWLIIFLTRFKNGFFNNLTTVESNDWLGLIHVLASRAACTWIVLPLGFCCGWDENLPFSWKLRAYVNFARVSLKSVMLWASWVLIVSCFSMNACNVSSRFLLGGGT